MLRITEIRKARGLSVYALAKRSGVTQSYLWRLEHGDRDNPSIAVLQKIADALGVGITDLWVKEDAS